MMRATGSADAPPSVPVALLVMVGLIGPLTIHMVVPALPAIQGVFGTDYARTQLLVSVYLVAFGVSQLFVGPLADRFGRRRTLVAGLWVFAAVSLMCPFAPSVEALIALRALQGASGCVGIVLSRSIVRDTTASGSSAPRLGYLAMGVALGPLLGPIAGGVLFEHWGWEAIFWFLGAFCAVALVLVVAFLPETRPRGADRDRSGGPLRAIVPLLRNRGVRLYSANVCFNTALYYAFVTGAPYVAVTLAGMSAAAYGGWYVLVAGGYLTGNFLSSRFGHRFGADRMVLAASLMIVLVLIALLAVFATGAGGVELLFIGGGLVTLASGVVMPNSLAGVLAADPARAGAASGFIGFAQFAAAAVLATATGAAVEALGSALPVIVAMLLPALGGLASQFMAWRAGLGAGG